jgi:4-carboxymuconolactone decarboxylase
VSDEFFGRYRIARSDELSVEEQASRDMLIAGPRGGISGPYKIWVLNAPLAGAMADLDQHLNTTGSLSAADREIAVLVSAERWDSGYVAAAHAPRAAASGVPEQAVEQILAGDTPRLPDPRQQLVYSVCRQLYAGGVLPVEMFEQATVMLNPDGLSDLIALLGYYTAVALTLNAYAVPG